MPSPDGDESRVALDPRLALCDDEAREAWLLRHPNPSWQAMFSLTYRGLVTAARTLRTVPPLEPRSYYLCDVRDDETDYGQIARFRSFADFSREPHDSPPPRSTRKWLQLVRCAQLAWAEMGWRGCNTNVTDQIIADGWRGAAGLGNTSAREGVFNYITLEYLKLRDGALVSPRKYLPDQRRLPFFDTPGSAAHIEALCTPAPYDKLPAALFDEATLARLRLRRGVDAFCRPGWRAACEDEHHSVSGSGSFSDSDDDSGSAS